MDKWFWAYRRLKKGAEAPKNIRSDIEWQKIENLATALTRPVWLKGDGLFSRFRNWLLRQNNEVEFLKLNWSNDDEKMIAFLLGIETAFSCAINEMNYLERISKEKRGK